MVASNAQNFPAIALSMSLLGSTAGYLVPLDSCVIGRKRSSPRRSSRHLSDALHVILVTVPGERLMLPGFGSEPAQIPSGT